jgi:hypothetical protein
MPEKWRIAMKVYHGSYTKIITIDLSKCLPNKDFGQGFYVTKYREHAEDWAQKMGSRYDTEGFVTEFEYTESAFAHHICKIKHFDAYNDEWLDFVVMNRNETITQPAHDYDIVEGPVANDKIQHRLVKFLSGKIKREDFLKELSYHLPTHQICFCTVSSLQLIKRLPFNEMRLNIMHIGEPLLEALMLDNQIGGAEAADLFYNSETFAQLEDENTQLNLKPWQEIYKMIKKELGIN